MPVPPIPELIWPTFQAVLNLGGSAGNQEMSDEVVRILGLSEEDQNATHNNGQTVLSTRLSFARSRLKEGGVFVNTDRGVWAIAPNMAQLTESEITQIHSDVLELYAEFRRLQSAAQRADKNNAPEGETDPKTEDNWKQALLETLQEMPPDAFERLCKRLLRESGFESVEVTGQPGDGGIDGAGTLRVDLVTFQVVFQCKRYKGGVSPSAVRDFRGAMAGRGEKGLIITTRSFTGEARKEAVRTAPSIDLVDGDRLCDLLKNLGLGVSTEMVERVNIDRSWFSGI